MTVSEQLKATASSFSDPVVFVAGNGDVLWLNPAAGKLFGISNEEMAGATLRGLVDDSDERFSEFLRFCFRSRRPVPGKLGWRTPDSERPLWRRCTGASIPGDRASVPEAVCIRILPESHAFGASFRILNRKLESQNDALRALLASREQLQMERDRATVTLYSIGDAVITTDAQEHIEQLNPVAEQLTGWREEEVMGRKLGDVFQIVNEHSGEPAVDPIRQCLRESRVVGLANHTLLIARNGTEYCIEHSAAPIFHQNGTIQGAVLVFRDVTTQRLANRKLQFLAHRDPLTTLPNRRHFEQHLDAAFYRASRGAEKHALIYIDLDQFKVVNDTAGHQVGDELLLSVASHLHGRIRGGDVLARLGGDEFGLLASDIDRDSALALANDIVSDLHDRPFSLSAGSYRVGASAGVAPIDEQSRSTYEVMRQADIACYISKRSGRGKAHLFSHCDEASRSTAKEMNLSTDIRVAMKEQRFRVVFQPIVAVANGQLSHYEVLLRMTRRDGTPESTVDVITAAERYGLMGQLDRWVIEAAFAEYATQQQYGNAVPLTINLSGASIGERGLHTFVIEALRRHRVPGGSIVFEATETAAISGLEHAAEFMSALRGQGCQFALDDFGTGFSSFNYLKCLPLNYLKIDKTFIRGLLRDSVDQAMVRSMVAIARSMGLVTVAEGVETQETLDVLRDLGVDLAQGFHISYPLASQSFSGVEQLRHYEQGC